MVMNIWAGKYDLVKFANPTNGTEHDIELAKERLVVGETYEIDRVVVHSSSTDVYLIGIKGSFNSVMFEDVEINEENTDSRAFVWYERH